MRIRTPAMALLATLLLCGCDLSRTAVNLTVPALLRAAEELQRESHVWIAREVALPQLMTAEGFLQTVPDNGKLLLLLAQGYVEFAFGLLEDEMESLSDDAAHDEQRRILAGHATDLYDRALEFALRHIDARDPRLRQAMGRDSASVEMAVARLGRDCVPGLLFAGFALAGAINLNRADLGRVIQLPKAQALLSRAHQLDARFYRGGGAMAMGMILTSRGPALGGDLRAARRLFEESISTSRGHDLMARVMMARHYAVLAQDRPLFQATLTQVLRTPPDILPERRLANELARLRAARYLARIDDLFP